VLKRVDVACALVYDRSIHKILMVKNNRRDSSYWSIPGGAVEANETLEQAVKRETKEETGYEIEPAGIYSVREVFFTGSDHHALIFTFLARITGGGMEVADPDGDVTEVKWMDLREANALMPGLPDITIESMETVAALYYFDNSG